MTTQKMLQVSLFAGLPIEYTPVKIRKAPPACQVCGKLAAVPDEDAPDDEAPAGNDVWVYHVIDAILCEEHFEEIAAEHIAACDAAAAAGEEYPDAPRPGTVDTPEQQSLF